MTRLIWDLPGERKYHTGLDRGVLSVHGGPTVPWNGLTSMTEGQTGGDVQPYYLDGVKYIDFVENADFSGTLEALHYPEEFEACEGVATVGTGLVATGQQRKRFNLSYRTLVGDDLDGQHYKLHLLYNCTATTSDKAYKTLGETTEPSSFQWTVTCVPEVLEGFRPAAHLILDSDDVDLSGLEDVLYGTDGTDPGWPTMTEVVHYVTPEGAWTCFDLATASFRLYMDSPDYPDGIVSGTGGPGPKICGFQVVNPDATDWINTLAYFDGFRLPDINKHYQFKATFDTTNGGGTFFQVWRRENDTTTYGDPEIRVANVWPIDADVDTGRGLTVHAEVGRSDLPFTYPHDNLGYTTGWEDAGDAGYLAFMFVWDADACLTSLCWREAPALAPGTYSVDIPATITAADMGYDGGPTVLKDPSTSTYTPVPNSNIDTSDFFLDVQYGDGDGLFNWTPPLGATVDSIHYVALAYREADVTPGPGFPPAEATPAPTTVPWLSLESDPRFELLAFPTLVVTTDWADASAELLVEEPDLNAVLVDDHPMNKLTARQWNTGLSANVQCAYLAARVTFTID